MRVTMTIVVAGGQMTTLKGEDIDFSGTPVNKGGLVASVGVNHKVFVERLPASDPEQHWHTHTAHRWTSRDRIGPFWAGTNKAAGRKWMWKQVYEMYAA